MISQDAKIIYVKNLSPFFWVTTNFFKKALFKKWVAIQNSHRDFGIEFQSLIERTVKELPPFVA